MLMILEVLYLGLVSKTLDFNSRHISNFERVHFICHRIVIIMLGSKRYAFWEDFFVNFRGLRVCIFLFYFIYLFFFFHFALTFSFSM